MKNLTRRSLIRVLLCLSAMLLSIGCQTHDITSPQISGLPGTREIISWRTERDHICTLAAYSVVFKGWQTDNKRGYNIGAVLLDSEDPDGRLVFWARNCNNVTENQTQHGEVRLILGYLARLHAERKQGQPVPSIKNLNGYTVYTTLEPCAQCSGMMTLQMVKRTVYGQTDPGFGKAIERLELDSRSLPNGFKPYPRPVRSERAAASYCYQLEYAYEQYKKDPTKKGGITRFLATETAQSIYKAAYKEFLEYEAKEDVNKAFLKDARALVESVPPGYVPLQPDI